MARVDTTGYTYEEVVEEFTIYKNLDRKTLLSFQESGTQGTYKTPSHIAAKIAWCQAAMRQLDPYTHGKRRKTAQSSMGSF